MEKGVVSIERAIEGQDIKGTKPTYKIVKANLREFGHYTLENRALAKVYDGLNPSQRRILWALWTLKRNSKAVPVKCATVIGEVIGKYHPHGDQSAYDTLVKLAWKRYPLVQRHGNFGSDAGLDVDPPAAMRYTETRLSAFGDSLFDDISVIKLVKSFTDEHTEPPILPARVPLLLANGSSGIALGLSTHIPPHSLSEVIKACIALVKNPEVTSMDLAKKYVHGPDYGPNTGAIISSAKDLQSLYVVGEGRVKYVCTYHIEEGKKTNKLVITGKSPGFSVNKFVQVTKDLADKKLIEAPANDEGSLEQPVRITVEFKDFGIIKSRIIPLLHTSQSYRFYVLDGEGNPRKYDLKEMLEDFLDFRRQIEEAVLKKEKKDLLRKLGIENAKRAAIDHIDFVVSVMKQSKTVSEAIGKLTKKLRIKEWQAEVILDSPIKSLMRLQKSTVEEKIKSLNERLDAVNADLSNIDGVVVRRLEEMLKFADGRQMPIVKNIDVVGEIKSSFKWMGVTEKGAVERFESIPTKSKAAWKYVSFTKVGDPILLVSTDGSAYVQSAGFLDKLKITAPILGAVPSGAGYDVAVIVTEKGYYCALDMAKLRTSNKAFRLFRNMIKDDHIFACLPLKKSGALLLWYTSGNLDVVDAKQIKVSRFNVNPKLLSKDFEGESLLNVWSVNNKGAILVSDNGEEMVGDFIPSKEKVFMLHKRNLIILKNGTRTVASQNEVLDLLDKKHGLVERVVPLPT